MSKMLRGYSKRSTTRNIFLIASAISKLSLPVMVVGCGCRGTFYHLRRRRVNVLFYCLTNRARARRGRPALRRERKCRRDVTRLFLSADKVRDNSRSSHASNGSCGPAKTICGANDDCGNNREKNYTRKNLPSLDRCVIFSHISLLDTILRIMITLDLFPADARFLLCHREDSVGTVRNDAIVILGYFRRRNWTLPGCGGDMSFDCRRNIRLSSALRH